MVPVIITTYPENGSASMALKEQIKLAFADAIAVDTVIADNIKLENTNDGRDIPLTFSYNANTYEITVTPADNGYNGNYLIGFTTYRLTVSGIHSGLGEAMQGVSVIEFTTVQDSIESTVEEPVIDQTFSITNLYPKRDSYSITPAAIKVKFNNNILPASVAQDSIVVTTDTVEDINDIGFVDIATVAGAVAIDSGNASILVFTPTAALTDNTKYTVIVKGVQSDTETMDTYMYSFYSKISPLYTTLDDIQSRYPSIAQIIKGSNPIDILDIIKDNSQMAEWIAEQSDNTDISWNPPSRYVAEYVKTKTRYDLLYDKYIQIAGDSTSKMLGDLQITYQMSLADLLDLIEKLKAEYERWEEMLRGSASGRAMMSPFNKGENIDDMPDYKTRSLKNWDGSKSW